MLRRSVAKSLGLKRYFTGQPCPSGHVAPRLVSSAACTECARLSCARWHSENREYSRAQHRAWLAANKETEYAKWRVKYAAAPERGQERIAEYRRRNPDYVGRWQRLNPARSAAKTMRYYARKLKATPCWADIRAIDAVYEEAARRTAATGVPHHVDHIVPLQGREVCGLHVAWNLRVIPARDNRRKSNRLIPDLACAPC
jgi:hypothetical protein